MTSEAFAPPVVATYGADGPVRTSRRPPARARLPRARHHRAWPHTCRAVRRTQRCARRSSRAAGSRGSPTAASAARSPSRSGTPWTGSAAGWTTSPRRAARCCWSASAEGPPSPAVWCWTTPRATPAPRSSTGPCRSTPVSPTDAGRLANLPRVRCPGRRRPRHPARAPRPDLGLPAGRVRRPDGRAAPTRGSPADGGHGPRAGRLDRTPR